MKRFLKFFALLILIFVVAGLLAYIINPKKVKRWYRDALGLTCVDYRQKVYSNKLKDRLLDYIGRSSVTGIRKCKNEDEILSLCDDGKLVKISSCRRYIIGSLSHSYPYLTRDAKDLLDEIGSRFRKKISSTRVSGSRFKVTSVTRTSDNLKKLRGVNGNASVNSPHQFGNAFDISYTKFSINKHFVTVCDEKYLMEALAEVIWQLRQEGKCWATCERQQSCFHVVAR